MADQGSRVPSIARIWRGRVRADRADEYAAYLLAEGIPPLEANALAVMQLREDRAEESEFVTVSFWESIEAMTRFTGGEPTRIHHLKRDPEFLIELPESVQIMRITAAARVFAAPSGGS